MLDALEKFLHQYGTIIALLAAMGNICTSLALYWTLVVNGQYPRFRATLYEDQTILGDIPTVSLEIVNFGVSDVYFSEKCLALKIPFSASEYPILLPPFSNGNEQQKQLKLTPGTSVCISFPKDLLDEAKRVFKLSLINKRKLTRFLQLFTTLQISSVTDKNIRVTFKTDK